MTYTSYHDSLTGLYNRNYYNKYISEESIPDGTTIFMCDVDGLKSVNDNYGHIFGDELICMAAQVLEESFRRTDIIARIGGDEFFVIVLDGNVDLAENAKKRIQEVINLKNSKNKAMPFGLSLSVGYAIADDFNENWDELINKADHLMYQEKALKKAAKSKI